MLGIFTNQTRHNSIRFSMIQLDVISSNRITIHRESSSSSSNNSATTNCSKGLRNFLVEDRRDSFRNPSCKISCFLQRKHRRRRRWLQLLRPILVSRNRNNCNNSITINLSMHWTLRQVRFLLALVRLQYVNNRTT